MIKEKFKIAVIGTGYVGLPLCLEFGKLFSTIGYDNNNERINNLSKKIDTNQETSIEEFNSAKHLNFSFDENAIHDCNIYIVTVPTPVDDGDKPDLSLLIEATELVSRHISQNDFIIFESTVYPGTTEEVCIPIVEKNSNHRLNKGFFVGYSPERVNPGDKTKKLSNIKKIVSGSNDYAADFIKTLYNFIITAGIYVSSSIKVAESAKVIENIQRDVNIALVNEFSLIFDRLNIQTHEVIEAASTKWNFMPFYPGLVGGHCVGVDPYYLAYKADIVGVYPELVLAGRRINQSMSKHFVYKFVKEMIKKEFVIKNSKVLVLGLSFKENCNDVRNTKSIDVIKELISFGMNVDAYDPLVETKFFKKSFDISPVNELKSSFYDGIIILVPHEIFKEIEVAGIKKLLKNKNGVVFDIKNLFPKNNDFIRV